VESEEWRVLGAGKRLMNWLYSSSVSDLAGMNNLHGIHNQQLTTIHSPLSTKSKES